MVFQTIRDQLDTGGVLALFENNPLNPATRWVMSRIPLDRDAVLVPAWEARRHFRRCDMRLVHHGYLFYFPRALRVLRPLERYLVNLPLGAQYALFATRD